MEFFDEERRARLLQFVTGSSRVPLQGFKALQGNVLPEVTANACIWRHITETLAKYKAGWLYCDFFQGDF